MSERNVVVVGGGLAGLCCARTIQRAGHHAQVFEASDGVGGRVRTDSVEGFLLDRGFQVLFTAYPAIRQEIDLDALDLKMYDPGALICWQGRRYTVVDPLRRPSHALSTALSPLFDWSDKLNVAKLTALLARMSVEEIFRIPDCTTEAYLRDFGFSNAFLDRFIRPFFGGIFLETGLETSARMFAFLFKMLGEGQTAVPAQGMGALPQQLAAGLAPGTLHLNSPVRELVRQGDRVAGVRLEDGQIVEGDRVVLATPFDVSARLGGLNLPATWRASTEVCFALSEPLYRERLLTLFTEPGRRVNHCAMVSNVAPSYAPAGQHLLSCTLLGDVQDSDEELDRQVRAELAPHFPQSDTASWRLLRVQRVRWAQFAQPTGVWEQLPNPRTLRPGLILAGEITVSSSLHGALVSGQRAAGLALSTDHTL